MKILNISCSILLVISFFANVYSQDSVEQYRIEMRRQMEIQRREKEAIERLRAGMENINRSKETPSFVLHPESVLPKPNERDRQAISVDNELLITHSKFLKQKFTGIFRLHDSADCNDAAVIVDMNSICPNGYPGKATAYSFRIKGYQFKYLSDLSIKDSKLDMTGVHKLSVITSLGNSSLDKLNLSSDGVKQLVELEPPTKKEDLQKYSKLIGKGVNVGNRIYSTNADLKLNQTYLLRVIAFKGIPKSAGISKYPAWKNDERDDVIIVFRTLKINEDKSWIILWKELARKDAPKITY